MIISKTTKKEKMVIIKSTNIESAYEEATRLYENYSIKNIKYDWVKLHYGE